MEVVPHGNGLTGDRALERKLVSYPHPSTGTFRGLAGHFIAPMHSPNAASRVARIQFEDTNTPCSPATGST